MPTLTEATSSTSTSTSTTTTTSASSSGLFSYFFGKSETSNLSQATNKNDEVSQTKSKHNSSPIKSKARAKAHSHNSTDKSTTSNTHINAHTHTHSGATPVGVANRKNDPPLVLGARAKAGASELVGVGLDTAEYHKELRNQVRVMQEKELFNKPKLQFNNFQPSGNPATGNNEKISGDKRSFNPQVAKRAPRGN